MDVSYVGNHGFNRLGAFQNGTTVNLNAVDIGAAYLPQNQDPTLGASAVPGASAYTTNLLRAYKGLGNINQNTTEFWDTYHSIQTTFNRRFRNGFSFGANYTYGMSFKGNTGLQQRLQHAADGTHLAPCRPGGVREAEREPRSPSARHQGELGVGPAAHAGPRADRRGDHQRLAAVRCSHRRRPVRHTISASATRTTAAP